MLIVIIRVDCFLLCSMFCRSEKFPAFVSALLVVVSMFAPFENGHPLSWGAPFVVGYGIFNSPPIVEFGTLVLGGLLSPPVSGVATPSHTHGRRPRLVP